MIGGQLAINAGSKYMFDFMYPQFTSYVEAGAQAMISSEVLFTPTNFQPSFTFYGLTFSTGAVSSGLLGGTDLFARIAGELQFLLRSLFPGGGRRACNSCPNCSPANNPNSLLAMHRDANLCVHVGSYCSARIPLSGPASNRLSPTAASTPVWPGSSMSRAGDRSAKAGGAARARTVPASPRPSSSSLDFSRIDMSEFIQEICFQRAHSQCEHPSDRTSKAPSSSASTATTTDESTPELLTMALCFFALLGARISLLPI
jgi:hypothetical protein